MTKLLQEKSQPTKQAKDNLSKVARELPFNKYCNVHKKSIFPALESVGCNKCITYEVQQ